MLSSWLHPTHHTTGSHHFLCPDKPSVSRVQRLLSHCDPFWLRPRCTVLPIGLQAFLPQFVSTARSPALTRSLCVPPAQRAQCGVAHVHTPLHATASRFRKICGCPDRTPEDHQLSYGSRSESQTCKCTIVLGLLFPDLCTKIINSLFILCIYSDFIVVHEDFFLSTNQFPMYKIQINLYVCGC